MTRSRLLLTSLLLLGAPALAQDTPEKPKAPEAPAFDDAAAEANTKELVAGMTALDESLLGSYHFGLHMGPAKKHMGTFVIELTKAPEGSAGVYKVDMRMSMGPFGSRSGVLILDSTLALVSATGEETRQGVKSKTQTEQKDGQWVHTKTTGEEEPVVTTLPVEGPDRSGFQTGILLAKKLDRSKTYLFKGVDWDGPKPETETVRVSFAGKATIDHRGKQIEVTKLISAEATETTDMMIDANGKVLQLSPRKAPLLLVAGTAEEVTQELPKATGEKKPEAEAGAAAAASPKAAVVVYFEVLAKMRKVEDLDAVMDWEAVREEMIKDNPETKILDANGIASLLKDQFRQAEAPLDKAQVAMLAAMVTEDITGDTAKVSMPGSDDPFTLRKGEGGWLITHFPH